MKEVLFDNVVFTKASELAREFKYTADYLGQLCRAGKIDARLVGRTWYVNRASLIRHRDNKYQVKPEATVVDVPEKTKEINVSRLDEKMTSMVMSAKNFERRAFETRSGNVVKLKYQDDDTPLIPALAASRAATIMGKPVDLRVTLGGAEPLAVLTKQNNAISLSPEPLATVYLHGKIPVTTPKEVPDEVIEPPPETEPVAVVLRKADSLPEVAPKVAAVIKADAAKGKKNTSPELRTKLPRPSSVQSDHSKAPEVVFIPITPLEVVASRPVAISVVVALCVAVLLVGFELGLEIIGTTAQQQVSFSAQNIIAKFR